MFKEEQDESQFAWNMAGRQSTRPRPKTTLLLTRCIPV
jgi:hypothetical protein